MRNVSTLQATSPSARSSSLHPDLRRRVDAVIDGALAADRIVGAVVIASVDGRTVYRRAAGLADREAGIPMREDTIFRLASVTKLVIATAAVTLVGQGRLNLDDAVAAWLPAFRPCLADGSPATITIRHLLTHTAGLSYGFLEPKDGPYHRAGVSDGMDRSRLTLEENMRRLASVPLAFAPGTAWNYSLSMDVLGAVIEKASKLTLPEAVRRLVTEPLGLANLAFTLADPSRLAAAYADAASRPRRMEDVDLIPQPEGLAAVAMDPGRAFDGDAFPSGGAGMVGTADDISGLLETLRSGGAPLVPETLVAEMGRDQIAALPVAGLPGWGYGLGFSVLRDPDAAATPESAGTWRWGGAYGHSWFVDPVEKLSVVALTNTAFEGTSGRGRFPHDVCRAMYNR